MQKKLIVALVLLFVVVILGGALIAWPAPQAQGKPFVSDKVIITSPLANSAVAKTFTVTGEAKGQWYFEASFPVQVRDKDNNKVGQGIAQAQGDWMTAEFVPFKADVTVTNYSGPATLVLLKDNPSGLPENEDSVEIPIVIQ